MLPFFCANFLLLVECSILNPESKDLELNPYIKQKQYFKGRPNSESRSHQVLKCDCATSLLVALWKGLCQDSLYDNDLQTCRIIQIGLKLLMLSLKSSMH